MVHFRVKVQISNTTGNYLVIVARWDNAKGHGTATKGVNYWEGMRDEIWWLER